jgi:hypothetical protein
MCSVIAAEAIAGRDSGLLVKLEAMRVKEPTAVLTTLHLLGLELEADFAILNSGERDEMMSGLRAQGMSLGDRSKVRHHFGALQAASAPVLFSAKPNEVHGDRASTQAGGSHEEPQDDGTQPSIQRVATGPRRTQDTQGVSSDSIALMATATLGILSFAVQARVSANERRQQADLDRETAERDKEQTKAGKLLERVQLQLAEFVEPGIIHMSVTIDAWTYIADVVGLESYLAHLQMEFISQPATPDEKFKMIYNANPKRGARSQQPHCTGCTMRTLRCCETMLRNDSSMPT